jgi:hypothetical protein
MAIELVIVPEGGEEELENSIQETSRSIRSVNATISAVSTEESESIVDVIVTKLDNEPNVFIDNTENFAKIVGKYNEPFEDLFTYVERGSSDLLEKPKIGKNLESVPAKKDFFFLEQDMTEEVFRNYAVSVVTSSSTYNFVVSHRIYNEWDALKDFVANYYNT